MLGRRRRLAPAAVTGSVLMVSTLTSAIAPSMGHLFDETSCAAAQVPQAVFGTDPRETLVRAPSRWSGWGRQRARG